MSVIDYMKLRHVFRVRVPDDTIFNAPLGNSFGLLHSPMPIILSVALDLQIIQFIVVQFTLGTIVGGLDAVETPSEGRQLPLKSCRLLMQEEFFLLLGHLRRSDCL